MSLKIYSVSRSTETLANHSAPHTLAAKARSNLHAAKIQNQTVTLFWIKAHAGLDRNKRVNQLAKEAALKLTRRSDQCPVSFVKRNIRKESLDEWNRKYKSSETVPSYH